MRSIDLHDVHVPTGPNLFALAVGGVISFSLAMFFFLVSWAVGGDDFKATIGGNIALGVIAGGLVVSAISAVVMRPKK